MKGSDQMPVLVDPPVTEFEARPLLPVPQWLSRFLTFGLYLLVLVPCALLAYWIIFTAWSGFDDEGFFDYSLKTFVGGHALYNSVFSEYGPFYYLAFGALFKLTGISVTMLAGRLITVGMWLGTSIGLGVTAQRFTRRLTVGLLVLVSSFITLGGVSEGPMHAQILVVALTMAMAAIVLLALPSFPRAAPAVLGATVAALALTKVNLGGYAFLAVGFAFIFAGGGWLQRRAVLLAASAVLVLLAPVVIRSEWAVSQQRTYAFAVALSALAIVATAWPRHGEPRVEGAPGGAFCWWLGGFAAGGVLVLLILFALGSSPHAWIEQTLIFPTRQADFLSIGLLAGHHKVVLGAAGVCLAVLARHWARLRLNNVAWLPVITGVARISAGLLMVMPAAALPWFRHLDYPYVYSWPLVWVVATPTVRNSGAAGRLGRVTLAALAVSQSLMAYPVAGAQVELGGLLFAICGGVCIADGLDDLTRWSRLWRGGRALEVAAVTIVAAVAGWAFWVNVAQPLSPFHRLYETSAPLHAIGGNGTRLEPQLSADINSIVALVHKLRCRTLLELPGEYSFNMWTGLDTPDPLTGQQPYWESLSAPEQEQVLRASREAPDLCLIRSEGDVEFYSGAKPLPHLPLLTYLDSFRTVATYGGSQLEVRAGTR